jgi:hypothetical protein
VRVSVARLWSTPPGSTLAQIDNQRLGLGDEPHCGEVGVGSKLRRREQIEPDESDVPGEDLDPPEPIVVARQSRSELCDLLGTGFAGSVGLGR